MADIDGRSVVNYLVKLGVYLGLGDGIEGCGGLVENQERRVLIERSCYSDLLRLAAGFLHAIIAICVNEIEKNSVISINSHQLICLLF